MTSYVYLNIEVCTVLYSLYVGEVVGAEDLAGVGDVRTDLWLLIIKNPWFLFIFVGHREPATTKL